MTRSASAQARLAEPWRQRLIRSLLYGRNVDRAEKARARVGFAMLAFVAIYVVIGGRLVMKFTGSEFPASVFCARTSASIPPATKSRI